MADTHNIFNRTGKSVIALVGMMGVGKSTVGRRLADRLGLKFFDADSEIEKAAGMSVSELFELHGEASFRAGEARVIDRLLKQKNIVLATGGGAVTNADTRSRLEERAVSIWLQADTETILRRATKRDTRPLLRNSDPAETIEKLVAERRSFYARSDIHIESQPGPHVNTVNLIIDELTDYIETSFGNSKEN